MLTITLHYSHHEQKPLKATLNVMYKLKEHGEYGSGMKNGWGMWAQ